MSAPVGAMREISGLLQAARYDDAHRELEKVITQRPDFAEAHRLLGGCKAALGDRSGAEAALRRALALDPNWAPTLTTLGEWLLTVGRVAEAESEVVDREIIGIRPDADFRIIRQRAAYSRMILVIVDAQDLGISPIDIQPRRVDADVADADAYLFFIDDLVTGADGGAGASSPLMVTDSPPAGNLF